MRRIHLKKSDYALWVDLIGAFFAAGGLPVPGAEELIEPIFEGVDLFPVSNRINLREMHPPGAAYMADSYRGRSQGVLTLSEINAERVELADHAAFTLEELRAIVIRHRGQGIMLWNAHAHTPQEMAMPPRLREVEFLFQFIKGQDRLVHSYSPFFDDLMRPTGLGDKLRSLGTKRTFSFGLAGDFCAGLCALHAAWEGFESYLVEDWCRNIDIPPTHNLPGTVEVMRKKLDRAGVNFINSEQLHR